MKPSPEFHMHRISQLRDARDAKIRRAQGRKVVLGTFLSLVFTLLLFHISVYSNYVLLDFVILVIGLLIYVLSGADTTYESARISRNYQALLNA